MKYNLCMTDEEVELIIATILSENNKITKEQILKEIESCCKQLSIVKKNQNFIECVRERIKIRRLENYKHK